MISFTLQCGEGHRFESWFKSAAAFDLLEASGHLSCAVCGASGVQKSLMAPRVNAERTADTPDPSLSIPEGRTAEALAALRSKIEANADYVGDSFASDARAMHEGELPERAIYGEVRGDEARKLIEDGVPVAPLPFRPKRKLQ
ncbi:DUF1178 domain-containing protein [Sulfitobacter sp. SK012]|uniref:DUF1178 family protein n=1 Tax=Sulfitobacter sp. SK012 TaxID=1389005 RepID=UPI000E0A6F4D|nr:DUF1178 family protein [Sulfitobacter sp. SK012]AXI45745.1 DUF1178 domain-containing protein [Sulfitobacter sp. SK012]